MQLRAMKNDLKWFAQWNKYALANPVEVYAVGNAF
jgi:hypothetical protein